MPGFEVLLAGRTLGDRYRVDAVVGRGGMGAVFRATDLRLNRAVALKVVTVQDDAEGRAQARFLREAQAAARIRHPHVVGVYDFGTDAALGLDFLVMELLEGEDLARRLARDTRLPPDEAARVFRQAAEGLAAGHRMGLVHRDVKPGNVFLVEGRGTHAVLLDYGVAQMEMGDEDTRTHLTRFGRQPLSPAYASPEQIRGEGALAPSSDVFSLGVTMYRAATGAAPYTPAELERLAAGEAVPRVPPRQHAPELDAATATALEHALDPDPARRPADADALLALLAGAEPPPRPAVVPPPPARVPAEPRRGGRGVWMGAAAAGVVGVAALAALATGGGDDPQPPAPPAVDSAALALAEQARLDSIARDSAARAAAALPVDTPATPVQPQPAPVEEPVPPPPIPTADQVYDVAMVDRPPVMRNRDRIARMAEDAYPREMRSSGVSADVILSFVVDREGRVEKGSVRAVNAANPAFVNAAERLADRMRFEPGQLQGVPVRTMVQIPIRFQPED
jgi:serine/threonine-protein kinase